MGSDSQLPSEHLPGKTPHDTLHYAMGDNPDMSIAVAAELLHCQKAGSSAKQLLDMVSRLTDTSTVSEPPLPCPPPATTALVWDCTSHMVYVRSLLQLVYRATLLAHYQIAPLPLHHRSGMAFWLPLSTWPAGRTGGASMPLRPCAAVTHVVMVFIGWTKGSRAGPSPMQVHGCAGNVQAVY